MGLQVRLRHALGERVLELPDRTVEQPVVIGRARDADVQVPSITVSKRHLVVFVHDGAYVVQNGPDSTGTTLNGKPLTGPRPLHGGEILTLGPGPDAPTLEIDPAGMLRKAEHPADQSRHTAAVAAHAPAGRMVVAGGPALPHQAHAYSQPVAAPYAQPAYEQHSEPAPSNGDHAADWMTADAASTAPRSYYVPKRKKSSDAAVALAVIAVVAILVGAGVIIYMHQSKEAAKQVSVASTPAAVKPAGPEVEPEVSTKNKPVPRSILTPSVPAVRPPPPPPDVTDQLDNRPKVKVREDDPQSETPTTSSSTGDMPDEKQTDPGLKPDRPKSKSFDDAGDANPEAVKAQKAWKHVESAYYDTDIARALLAFDTYAEEYPDQHKAQITQYREDTLDKLWWNRVDDLFHAREKLDGDIKKTEADIKTETEAAYRKTVLEPRLEDQKARREALANKLAKEMRYTQPKAPPIGHEAQLVEFRTKRDDKTYAAWKTEVLKTVRRTHGSLPWANDK